MKKRKWCVDVYGQPHTAHVMATRADKAEILAIKKLGIEDHWHIEVMRVCVGCKNYNDKGAKKCEVCKAKL